MPYLVFTVQPSMSGSRSRCTPSRETSAPIASLRRATLSISSMKTMPVCSTAETASALSSSSLMSLNASSSRSRRSASRTFRRMVRLRVPPMLESIPCSWLVSSSMPGGETISKPTEMAAVSMVTSLSSRSPSRSFLRITWRVVLVSRPPSSGAGSSTSRIRSSAASSARDCTRAIACSRSIFTAMSARSRMMDSTSRPT